MEPIKDEVKSDLSICEIMNSVEKEFKSRPRKVHNGPSRKSVGGKKSTLTWSEEEELHQRHIETMYTSEQIEFMCNNVRTLSDTFFGTTRLNWTSSNSHIANIILRQYIKEIRPDLVKLPMRPVDYIPNKVWETMLGCVIAERARREAEIALQSEMWNTGANMIAVPPKVEKCIFKKRRRNMR